MDYLISTATSLAQSESIKLGLRKVSEYFGKKVIEKWSKYRSENFFNSLISAMSEELDNGCDPIKLEIKIDEVLNNENASEFLFESYRNVVLARSKEIGPRVIAYLTAKIIVEKRHANDEEELFFEVLGNLNDQELEEFVDFVGEYYPVTEKNKSRKNVEIDKYGNLTIEWCKEQQDSNSGGGAINLGPINFYRGLGLWAGKLKNFGLLEDDISERHFNYYEDSERYIDEDGSVREVTWYIKIKKVYLDFALIVKRFVDYQRL